MFSLIPNTVLSGAEPSTIYTLAIVGILALIKLSMTYLTDPRRKKLPPGPSGLPLLGNFADMADSEKVRKKVASWAQKYGELVYTRIAEVDYVWLSSPGAVKDLMDKKSAIYSSRPRMPFAMDVASGGKRQLLMPYSNEWRNIRKYSHQLLNLNASKAYQPIQDYESLQTMYDIMNNPAEFYKHNQRYSASVIMTIAYGIRVPTFDSPIAKDIYIVLDNLTNMTAPGAHAVDSMPDPAKNGIDDLAAAYICGGLVEAGSETTSSSLNNFVLAMCQSPNVLKKAQEELDRVVGDTRMPTFDDESNLPYVRAIIKELLRWRPVNKFGMFHASTEDDWHNGYFIPKDSIVILSWWQVTMGQL
ncbi:putative cytochrome p450 protein [Eutypa lata UCREL1]|uniref:Putative cytochrome p450 protein n=1 Tax=Eutypa lata (strain UCR-EL1) TaxID=1287681 RepID=M7ST44_EUTLA|nr:putative cytochrome p450 protein [Eutypa lata UCREL1]